MLGSGPRPLTCQVRNKRNRVSAWRAPPSDEITEHGQGAGPADVYERGFYGVVKWGREGRRLQIHLLTATRTNDGCSGTLIFIHGALR